MDRTVHDALNDWLSRRPRLVALALTAAGASMLATAGSDHPSRSIWAAIILLVSLVYWLPFHEKEQQP